MQLANLLLLAAAATASALTRPKANEYKDTACNDWNYGHNSFFLTDVTMDDTTNSVYLTNGQDLDGENMRWYAYDDKTGNGGSCTGNFLGPMANEGCININEYIAGSRIRCLRSSP
ncbi:hypothetical protein OQA88_893 [Cercophora sp. LCS_1]